MPFNTIPLFFIVALFFIAMVQIEVFEIAFVKLGLTPQAALLILVGTLLGSGINLPFYTLNTTHAGHFINQPGSRPRWEIYYPAKSGKIVLAINVGGCIIPLGLCAYFIGQQLLAPASLLMAILVISAVSYKFSKPIPGLGVAMPVFIPPLLAALLALLLDPAHAAQFAYISGVLGVLLGADIFRFKDITKMGAPVASIGGAGTFDGIFLTGILAALLA